MGLQAQLDMAGEEVERAHARLAALELEKGNAAAEVRPVRSTAFFISCHICGRVPFLNLLSHAIYNELWPAAAASLSMHFFAPMRSSNDLRQGPALYICRCGLQGRSPVTAQRCPPARSLCRRCAVSLSARSGELHHMLNQDGALPCCRLAAGFVSKYLMRLSCNCRHQLAMQNVYEIFEIADHAPRYKFNLRRSPLRACAVQVRAMH